MSRQFIEGRETRKFYGNPSSSTFRRKIKAGLISPLVCLFPGARKKGQWLDVIQEDLKRLHDMAATAANERHDPVRIGKGKPGPGRPRKAQSAKAA